MEIQSVDGEALDGFSLDDCPEIFGDSVNRTIQWNQGSGVTQLAGRTVRLRFELKDADIYSFRFDTEESD